MRLVVLSTAGEEGTERAGVAVSCSAESPSLARLGIRLGISLGIVAMESKLRPHAIIACSQGYTVGFGLK